MKISKKPGLNQSNHHQTVKMSGAVIKHEKSETSVVNISNQLHFEDILVKQENPLELDFVVPMEQPEKKLSE